jgi:hypothetical protein
MPSADDVLFEYVWQTNPKSNDDLERFLRLYPEHRDEIIEFTATWRALSISGEGAATGTPGSGRGTSAAPIRESAAACRATSSRARYACNWRMNGFAMPTILLIIKAQDTIA